MIAYDLNLAQHLSIMRVCNKILPSQRNLIWHHHIALVMKAMLFMLETRLSNRADYTLLSCADIQSLLAHFLPRRDVTVEEVMKQMEE